MSTIEILYLDIEATLGGQIKEFGAVMGDAELCTTSLQEMMSFIKDGRPSYIAGHNFIAHDLELLKKTSMQSLFDHIDIIDTLPVSLLFFNEKTFHHLPKNYKNEDDFFNDPVEDSKLTRRLFEHCVNKFKSLSKQQQTVFYSLLYDQQKFKGFFYFLDQIMELEILAPNILVKTIEASFQRVLANPEVIEEALFNKLNVELAYILALLTPVIEIKAHPPKILFDHPKIVKLQKRLCFNLQKSADGLSDFAEDVFGFGAFREFDRLGEASLFHSPKISQREIMEASLRDESFIAVLPTGGGKTFTFWLPALLKAKSYKGLTVVISPLQALIKDHIESFHKQVANFTAVALSGYLSALERADAIEKVVNGEADILYLAPESLRSNTIFSMLKNRLIERFVVDEAHCLSTWGNDFRHDYFYIGEFLKDLLNAKSYQSHIPVSCFTATGKPNVLDDINNYFKGSCNLSLERYIAVPERHNLTYDAFKITDQKQKYTTLLQLINEHQGASLVYIPSSTKKCDEIAEQLKTDTGKNVHSFHSKLESDDKMKILQDYVNDDVDVVVATTAFGMGVDKPNIMNVIHYEASESLENYAQEAGRGARDQNLQAYCPLLFNNHDLDKHFNALNLSKVTPGEINAVFRVLKNIKQNPILKTTLEIAKAAHWDVEDANAQYDTKIKTALLELEREGYLQRKRNRVRFFADAVAKNSLELLKEQLENGRYTDDEKQRLMMVLQTILGRGKPKAVQVDELAFLLGYDRAIVSGTILQLKEMKIINDSKDLSLHISRKAIAKYDLILKIERKLFLHLKSMQSGNFTMGMLNEMLIDQGVINVDQNVTGLIKEILRHWRAKEVFLFSRINRHKDIWRIQLTDPQTLQDNARIKHQLAAKTIEYFTGQIDKKTRVKKVQFEFSLKELKERFELDVTLKSIEKALLYLHEMKLLELGEGRFIYYSPMSIHKTDKFDQKIKYTKAEYNNRLAQHYRQKVESIHLMGEYAKRLLKNKGDAAAFMKDYFTMDFAEFSKKHGLSKRQLARPMSQQKYEEIFKSLSEEQSLIMKDQESRAMMILAGPGSGKTKVLVHKIASLILSEDVKPDQFLMLTYSRAAMMEFRSRLFALIGQLANDVDIYTFHGYALQLIGRRVERENNALLQSVVRQAAHQINLGQTEVPFKAVMVLDEYQDINEDGFDLVKAIYEANSKDMRIIAVGDDDQCIMERTNGADIAYISRFQEEFGSDEEGNSVYQSFSLVNNYRSDKKIVDYAEKFIDKVAQRFKHERLVPVSKKDGDVEVRLCSSPNMVEPVFNAVKQLQGFKTIAVLTHTNDEVASLYSMLRHHNLKAQYLLDSREFKLKELIEIYHFNELLRQAEQEYDEHLFNRTFQAIEMRYANSKNLDLLKRVIERFLDDNEIYSVSIWENYLDEIDSAMFQESSHINVSTIHKAKGREFDAVVMMVRKNKMDDYYRRLYYVGITRAKQALRIVSNDEIFNVYDDLPFDLVRDNAQYPEPKIMTLVMGLSDVNLGFTGGHNLQKYDLYTGTKAECVRVYAHYPRMLMQDGDMIAQLSKKFESRLSLLERKGYVIREIEIENVVYWYDQKRGVPTQQPLCKITLYAIKKE